MVRKIEHLLDEITRLKKEVNKARSDLHDSYATFEPPYPEVEKK